MALADGDYRAVEEQVVATLLADSGSGGLCETGDPAVATIRAGDPELTQIFGQSDYPAILIRVTGKTESPAPAYSVLKSFSVRATVLARGMDRPAAELEARKISARLEKALRDQTRSDQQFQGLPDLIEASEGTLVCAVTETRFEDTEAGSNQVIARAVVQAELQVPCAFRYE